MNKIIFACATLLVFNACKTAPQKGTAAASVPPKTAPATTAAPTAVNPSESVELRLLGKTGELTKTYYHSDSSVEDYEERQKVRDHEELMDFLVSTEVIAAREHQFAVRTKTLKKDGVGSLHDYAFPEPDEEIDFIYSRDGRVLSADPFPKESIFYMPPISLPAGAVKVGDTWTMDHAWISSSDGLPLNLNLVTIFKGFIPCGTFGQCVDLEVSGRVDVVSPKLQALANFDSKLWGRILFSLQKGDVVWSEVRSHEVFKTAENEVRVLSCMVSVMEALNGSKPARAECKPSTKTVDLPKFKF